MTIFNSAYSTHATTGYVVNKLQSSLESNYYRYDTRPHSEGVHSIQGAMNDVPLFNYPYILKLKDKDVAFFDARNITTMQRDGSSVVRDQIAFQSRAIHAKLALDWHQGYQNRIRDINGFGLAVYASWLGEVIAKRFALDPMTQLHVSILAGIFYINNFWDKTEADKEDVAYIFSALTRICGYRNSDIVDIIEAYPIIRDVEDFCTCVKEFTQNVRLGDLNPATLYGVVRGSWFSSAGGEIVAVALEYPPTWLYMLFEALVNRGFKKAGLTAIAERNSYRKYHEGFIRQLADLGAPDGADSALVTAY